MFYEIWLCPFDFTFENNNNHHHHLFCKRLFLASLIRVRGLPGYEVTPQNPEHCPVPASRVLGGIIMWPQLASLGATNLSNFIPQVQSAVKIAYSDLT